MASVGQDQALALYPHREAGLGERLVEALPGGGGADEGAELPDLRSTVLDAEGDERLVLLAERPLLLADLRFAALAAILLAGELALHALLDPPVIDRRELELLLHLGEAQVNPLPVPGGGPGLSGHRVDPVDHEVEVFVLGVVMGDDHGLMLAKPDLLQEPIGDIAHGLRRQPVIVGGGPGERQMEDRLLGPRAHRGGRLHGPGRELPVGLRIKTGEVPGIAPGDAPLLDDTLVLRSFLGRQGALREIGGEPLEAFAIDGLADHGSPPSAGRQRLQPERRLDPGLGHRL